jgi:hypothetical protein
MGKPPFRFRNNPFHARVFHHIFAIEKRKEKFNHQKRYEYEENDGEVQSFDDHGDDDDKAVPASKRLPYIYSMGNHDALTISTASISGLWRSLFGL